MIETLIPDINNLKKKKERERYRERISANLSKGVKKNYKIPQYSLKKSDNIRHPRRPPAYTRSFDSPPLKNRRGRFHRFIPVEMQLLLKSGSARGSPRHATSNLCVRFEELSRATCFSRKIRLLASFPIPGYNIKILTTSLELLSYWLFRCYYNSPFSSFSFFLSLIFFHYLFLERNILIF